jgi:hypothetical protein
MELVPCMDLCSSGREGAIRRPTRPPRISPAPIFHTFPHRILVWGMWSMWSMELTSGRRDRRSGREQQLSGMEELRRLEEPCRARMAPLASAGPRASRSIWGAVLGDPRPAPSPDRLGMGQEKPRELRGKAVDARPLPYNASRIGWVQSPAACLLEAGGPEVTGRCSQSTLRAAFGAFRRIINDLGGKSHRMRPSHPGMPKPLRSPAGADASGCMRAIGPRGLLVHPLKRMSI